VDKIAETIQQVGQTLWNLAEVSLLEVKSAAYLKDLLKSNGFTIKSEGGGGVPGSQPRQINAPDSQPNIH